MPMKHPRRRWAVLLLAVAALMAAGVTAFVKVDETLGDRLSLAAGSAGASPCA